MPKEIIKLDQWPADTPDAVKDVLNRFLAKQLDGIGDDYRRDLYLHGAAVRIIDADGKSRHVPLREFKKLPRED